MAFLINPSETAMTIIWFTNKNCTSWVEYGDVSADTIDLKAIDIKGNTLETLTISSRRKG